MQSPLSRRSEPLAAPDRIEDIPLKQIFRDPHVNTRELDNDWVSKRVPVYSEAGIGTLVVSERPDGMFSILDGQHRMALMIAAGYGDDMVRCAVHTGLALQQEAALFKLLNDRRALTPLHKFLARLTEGDLPAVEVAAICERTSWTIAENPGPGVLQCVAKLEAIHRMDRRRKIGAGAVDLERTLRTIVEAWHHEPGTSSADLIGGIGEFYRRYEESIDRDKLVGRLAGYPGGARQLVLNGKGVQSLRGGTVAKSVGELIWQQYNKGPGKNLPSWL